jgi:hypothetical protein
MVLIRTLLAASAIFASAVVADDEPTNDVEAAAFWNQLETIAGPDVLAPLAPITDIIEERGEDDYSRRPVPRPPKVGNPYQGRKCSKALDIDIPKRLSCERNECFKYDLVTSQTSLPLTQSQLVPQHPEGGSRRKPPLPQTRPITDTLQHCPSEAFGFCCLWLSAGNYGKKWAVKNEWVFRRAPYAKACNAYGDKPKDVIRKIDDVCGCTIKQKVTIEVGSEYYKLRGKKVDDDICRLARPNH